jgi:hypothetical protein
MGRARRLLAKPRRGALTTATQGRGAAALGEYRRRIRTYQRALQADGESIQGRPTFLPKGSRLPPAPPRIQAGLLPRFSLTAKSCPEKSANKNLAKIPTKIWRKRVSGTYGL